VAVRRAIANYHSTGDLLASLAKAHQTGRLSFAVVPASSAGIDFSVSRAKRWVKALTTLAGVERSAAHLCVRREPNFRTDVVV
jgi:hypothetical protein